jgi:hypothetical protein
LVEGSVVMTMLDCDVESELMRQELRQRFSPAFGLGLDLAALVLYGSGWVQDGQKLFGKVPASLERACSRNFLHYQWSRLLDLVRQPIREVRMVCGLRAVQVLGQSVFVFLPNGCIRAFAWNWKEAVGPVLEEVSNGSIALSGEFLHRGWMDRLAFMAHAEIKAHSGVASELARAFAQWAFDMFGGLLAQCCDLAWMRERVRAGMALDTSIVPLAEQTMPPLGLRGSLSVAQYNLVRERKAELVAVQREASPLVFLYAALCCHPQFPSEGEPLWKMKSFLRRSGLSQIGWTMALCQRKSDLRFIYEFYRGNLHDAVTDYLLIVDAVGLHHHRPRWLLAAAFSPYGSSAHPRVAYKKSMQDDKYLATFAHIVRLYHAERLDPTPKSVGDLVLVFHWLSCANEIRLDRAQRQRGWPLLLQRALAWTSEESIKASADQNSWPVPFLEAQIGRYRLRALANAYELWREGNVMHHCVGSHVARCLAGESLIFSVSNGGGPMGTVEYKATKGGWQLSTALGPQNSQLPQRLLTELTTASALLSGFKTSKEIVQTKGPKQ